MSPRVASLESHSTSVGAGSTINAAAYSALRRNRARSSRKERNRRIARRSAVQDGKGQPSRHGEGGLAQSDALAHLALLQQQVAQAHALEHFVDLLLEQNPH